MPTRMKKKPRKPAAAAPARPWSASDVRRLRALAGNTPRVRIAAILKRSPGAVTFKAFTQQISLRRKGSKAGRPTRKRKARR